MNTIYNPVTYTDVDLPITNYRVRFVNNIQYDIFRVAVMRVTSDTVYTLLIVKQDYYPVGACLSSEEDVYEILRKWRDKFRISTFRYSNWNMVVIWKIFHHFKFMLFRKENRIRVKYIS